MANQASNTFRRAVQATSAVNRLKAATPSLGLSGSGNRNSASSFGHPESEAASQFERLSSAVNDEQLSQRISIVKAQLESDPAFLSQWAHLIVEKEYGWLAVMQRVFNNPNEGTGARDKQSLSAILCRVATKLDEVKGLRSVLLATKLSCILTVDGPGITEAVQCVLTCCQSPNDFDVFLNKMQGYENVDAFLQFANLAQASLLLGTMLGKHPGCAKPFVDNQFDTQLMRKAVKSLSLPEVPLAAMKYTLYSLRFLVRQHVNDFTFAERCLSICSHMASRLGAESSELAADVCSVIQQVTFISSHPNIVAYLLAGCQHWRTTAARKLPIAAMLARCVVQYPREQLAQASVRIYKSVAALVCVFTDAGALESVDLIAMLLHCVQCVLRSMPAGTACRYLDFRQLRLLRDFITEKTSKSSPSFEGVMDRWMSIVMILWNRAFSLCFSAVASSVLRLVQNGRLSKALYEKHFGVPFTEAHATAHDDAVKKRLDDALEGGLEIESGEVEARKTVEEEERTKRQKIAKRFVEAMQVILSSDTQRYFDAMILPGCKRLEDQVHQAKKTTAALEARGSTNPRQESTLQRHARLTASLTKTLVGAPVDEQTNTQVTFSIFLGVDLARAKQRDAWAANQRLTISRATEESLLKDKAQALRHARLLLELEEQSARGFGWYSDLDSAPAHDDPSNPYPTSICCRELRARAKLRRAYLESADEMLTYSTIIGRSQRPQAHPLLDANAPDVSAEAALLATSLENDESLWVPTPAALNRELSRAESKSRKLLMNSFLTTTLVIVCSFDESLERSLLIAAYAAWVKAAAIAAGSPSALRHLATSTELLNGVV